jgi:hypothetical protein
MAPAAAGSNAINDLFVMAAALRPSPVIQQGVTTTYDEADVFPRMTPAIAASIHSRTTTKGASDEIEQSVF